MTCIVFNAEYFCIVHYGFPVHCSFVDIEGFLFGPFIGSVHGESMERVVPVELCMYYFYGVHSLHHCK